MLTIRHSFKVMHSQVWIHYHNENCPHGACNVKWVEHLRFSCGFECGSNLLKLKDFLAFNMSEHCLRMDQAADDGGKIVLWEELLWKICTMTEISVNPRKGETMKDKVAAAALLQTHCMVSPGLIPNSLRPVMICIIIYKLKVSFYSSTF